MRKANIVDVYNFLSLVVQQQPTKDSIQFYRQLCKSQNSHSMGSFGSEQAQKAYRAQTRHNSQKKIKRSKIVYQIVDNQKIILYRNPSSANSFNFDHVQQFKLQNTYLIDWIYSSFKNLGSLENRFKRQANIRPNCKLILAHNYQLKDCYTFISLIGKKLIQQGFIFRAKTKLFRAQGESLPNAKNYGQRKSSKKFHLNSEKSELNKNIKLSSQLKEYVSNLRLISESIQQIWIISKYFQFGLGVCQARKNNYGIRLLQNLINSYQENISEDQSVNIMQSMDIKVAISTLCQFPSQNNLQKCKRIFQQSITLRNNLVQYAGIQKSLFSFRTDALSQNQSQQMRKKQNQSYEIQNDINLQSKILKQTETNNLAIRNQNKNSRKSVKIIKNKHQPQNWNQGKQNQSSRQRQRQPKNKRSKQIKQIYNQSGSSSQDQQKGLRLRKHSYNMVSTENNMTNIIAQNIHLKWQLQTMQKQYEIQSQKFILKTQKKYKDIIQQRSFCLQQNGRLRKDNEQLLKQINTIRLQYESVIKSRVHYQANLQHKNRSNQLTIQSTYVQKIKQLQLKLREKQIQSSNLQLNLNQAKASLDDVRRRNKERIQQLTEQLQNYKKFCQQFKIAYDQLESQSRLDQDRCQNLEKRCKKYQQSLSDLLKLKMSMSHQSQLNQSVYSSVQSSQILCKAYQIINQQDQKQFTLKGSHNKQQKPDYSKQQVQSQRKMRKKSLSLQTRQKQKQKQMQLNQKLEAQLKSKLSFKRQSGDKKQLQKIKEKDRKSSQVDNPLEIQSYHNKRQKKSRQISFGEAPNKIK